MEKTKEELMQLKQEYDSLNDKLKDLSEEELKEVVGGSGKIKTVTIPLELPTMFGDSMKISVYIDGQLDSSLSKEVDPIVGVVNLPIKGTVGTVYVKVKLGNTVYKNFFVNFDFCTYAEF